jgi:hypothetical protein
MLQNKFAVFNAVNVPDLLKPIKRIQRELGEITSVRQFDFNIDFQVLLFSL